MGRENERRRALREAEPSASMTRLKCELMDKEKGKCHSVYILRAGGVMIMVTITQLCFFLFRFAISKMTKLKRYFEMTSLEREIEFIYFRLNLKKNYTE